MNSEVYRQVINELPQSVTLVAVSKYFPSSEILEAYSLGQRVFAESRPQELQAKIAELGDKCPGLKWHFIGHLQTNKLKMVLPYVDLIHSVDSRRLLEAISRYADTNGLKVNVLLEVHIAHEESKQGFSPEEVLELVKDLALNPLSGVQVCGLMGMASYSEDRALVLSEFQELRATFEACREALSKAPDSTAALCFKEISMGMSGDYGLAIEAGSTMIRLGSLLFA